MSAPAIALTMTKAGQEAFTAAQAGGNVNLLVTHLGLTDQAFVVAPTLTALPGQFKTIATISGAAVGDNIVHLMIRDDSTDAYGARGLGLFLADGTLFAVYGQADELFTKSALSSFLTAVDIVFPTPAIDALTFGDTNFLNPPATTQTAGVVVLATNDDGDAGTDTAKAITAAVLAHVLATIANGWKAAVSALAGRTIGTAGLATGGGDLTADRTITVAAASAADVLAGAAADRAITPAAHAAALPGGSNANGRWSTLPDGSIVQRGVVHGAFVEGPQPLTFPLPFPNACEVVVACSLNSANDNTHDNWAQAVSWTQQGAIVNLNFPQAGGSPNIDGFTWVAFGI